MLICPPNKSFSVRNLAVILSPLLALIAALLLFYAALQAPSLLLKLPARAGEGEALTMLRAYRLWYLILMGIIPLSVLLTALPCIFALRAIIRLKVAARQLRSMISLSILAVGFPLFLGVIMCSEEEVPRLYTQAGEDITQLERNEAEQKIFWLDSTTAPTGLPGPYAGGQPEPLTRFNALAPEASANWIKLYIPDWLDFSADTAQPFYQSRSIEWNLENAQAYRFTYTSNLHLVVAAEPAPIPVPTREKGN